MIRAEGATGGTWTPWNPTGSVGMKPMHRASFPCTPSRAPFFPYSYPPDRGPKCPSPYPSQGSTRGAMPIGKPYVMLGPFARSRDAIFEVVTVLMKGTPRPRSVASVITLLVHKRDGTPLAMRGSVSRRAGMLFAIAMADISCQPGHRLGSVRLTARLHPIVDSTRCEV